MPNCNFKYLRHTNQGEKPKANANGKAKGKGKSKAKVKVVAATAAACFFANQSGDTAQLVRDCRVETL